MNVHVASGELTVAGAEAGTSRAVAVIVGGHEGGGRVAVGPSVEYGPLLYVESACQLLDETVRRALDSSSLPVCVVPMTLGRDPRLVADAARTLTSLTADPAAAGRVMLAEPFGSATLLTGWLRVAVARAVRQHGGTDLAILLTAYAANRFDDAELCRIAHLVKSRAGIPWMEVAFRDGAPDLAEGIERCRRLGAGRVAVVAADFGPATDVPLPGVIDCGPLLASSAIAGMLATRVAGAMLKFSRGDDGIAVRVHADPGHSHGHGGEPWGEKGCDAD